MPRLQLQIKIDGRLDFNLKGKKERGSKAVGGQVKNIKKVSERERKREKVDGKLPFLFSTSFPLFSQESCGLKTRE